jgi:hypothetical protein
MTQKEEENHITDTYSLTRQRQDNDKTKKITQRKDRDNAEKRPRQDKNKTETRRRHDRDRTKTKKRHKQDRDKTETIPHLK